MPAQGPSNLWFNQNPGDIPEDVLEGLEQFISEAEPNAYIAWKNGRSTPEQREVLSLKAKALLEEFRQEMGEEQPLVGILIIRK